MSTLKGRLEKHPEKIEEAIKDGVEGVYISLVDEDGDGEAAVNRISWLSIDDVVKNDGGHYGSTLFASVNLNISVTYADPSMTMSDSEDNQEYVFGYRRADLDRDVPMTAEVTILWDELRG